MLRAFKHFNKSIKTEVSIRLLILICVCGILESSVSTLSAEELHVYPGSLVFNSVQGHAQNETRSLFIYTSLGTSINWSESKNASWLTTDAHSGSTDDVLKVGVNTTGLTAGTYNGTVTVQSAQSSIGPIVVHITLIVNPDVPVQITTWKDGYSGAMSVSVDDSKPSGFDDLVANGFSGSYVMLSTTPPSFYADYYNAGMELGCHTVTHTCGSLSDDVFRNQELEPNILGLAANTPEPQSDIITFVWPCGYTNYREQAIASDYFLSSRGYNFNQLEDVTPENFMNLKSFNSHEHTPFPPADLKTVVDDAVNQKKWFNLVLHSFNNDDGAINYAHSNDIWVTSIGTVIKYILQRDRFILTEYNAISDSITFKGSRLSIPSSAYRSFESAFGSNDLSTVQVDIDDTRAIQYVRVDGVNNSYQIKDLDGNKVLLVDVRLEPVKTKKIVVRYPQLTNALTISGVTANNKVYNGTTSATINTGSATLVGVLSGDIVTLVSSGAVGTFNNKNAGTSKTVITSGFALSGPDAGKYTLISPTPIANISKANLTVSGVTANDKIYDGSIYTTVNTGGAVFSGVVPGDVVTLVSSGASGIFSDKDVDTGKSVLISGLNTGGKDGSNYNLSQPVSSADITQATLTITGVTADSRTYNNTNLATLNTSGADLSGVFGSDVVTLNSASATATFNNKNAGTNKPVVTAGFNIGGTDSYNYTLEQPSLTANITPAVLTITGVTANSKVYNSNTSTTLNTGSAILHGIYGTDVVTLVTSGAKGTFADKNAGLAKVVSCSGFTLGGSGAVNYTLTQPSATADITKANLTVTGVTASNRSYNGTTTATLNSGSISFAGVFSGDVVTLVSSGASGTFANKNVGTGKQVIITGFTTGGADDANYTLTQPSAAANITPASVSVSGIIAGNKLYDGTTSVSLNTGSAAITSVFGTDAVTLNTSGINGAFNNKNAGSGKAVTISGLTLGGTDAGNYTLMQPTLTANITSIPLTVTGVIANNKQYNASLSATLNSGAASLSGILPGDIVTLITAGASGTFSNKNAGTGKTVNATGYILGGADSGNYILIQPTLTADITKGSLSVNGVSANNKVYDGTTMAILSTGSAGLSGIYAGDAVTLISSSAAGSFADKNIGPGKAVTTTGFSIGGTDANNYSLTQPVLTANISSKSLTLTAKNLTKSCRTLLTFTGSEYTETGLIPGDIISGLIIESPGSIVSAAVGTYVISLHGAINGNYSISYINGILKVNKAVITAKADNKIRLYGSDNPALSISYSGFINGDDVSVLKVRPSISTNAISTSSAGTYPIVLTGGSDDNYDLALVNGLLTIGKAPLNVTADDKTKSFGEANPELTLSYSGFVNGQAQSVLDILPVASTDADINSDAGTYDINVSGASDRNYSIITNKGTLNISKADQLITFDAIPSRLRMTQQSRLAASTTSGLPVSFVTSDPTVGIVEGDTLKVKKEGHLTISAIQKGDHNWNAAQDVSQIIETLPTFDGISSLFTPNNDGMNDYWYIPELEQYGKLQVTVYNRFGQAVYRSDSYKNDWDGTWNGSPLPSASYYYIIRSSARGFIKGVVNIVR